MYGRLSVEIFRIFLNFLGNIPEFWKNSNGSNGPNGSNGSVPRRSNLSTQVTPSYPWVSEACHRRTLAGRMHDERLFLLDIATVRVSSKRKGRTTSNRLERLAIFGVRRRADILGRTHTLVPSGEWITHCKFSVLRHGIFFPPTLACLRNIRLAYYTLANPEWSWIHAY